MFPPRSLTAPGLTQVLLISTLLWVPRNESLCAQPEPSPDAPLLRAHERRAAGDLSSARAEYARIATDTNAAPALRSLAQLSLAQSWRDAKDWPAAEAAYGSVLRIPAAPAHHQHEAGRQIAAIQRLAGGDPTSDPTTGRYDEPARALLLQLLDGDPTSDPTTGRYQPPRRPTPGAEFHVAPDGSDSGPGTPAQPLGSLEGARDAIRRLKATDGLPAGGVEVIVHGGRYSVRDSFRLEGRDSGASATPIAYLAAGVEKPVFSGGARLVGFELVRDAAILARLPEEARGRVFQADLRRQGVTNVPPVRVGGFASGAGFRSHPALELFFNGEALPLARWPNEGFVKVVEARGQTAQPGHGPAGTKEGVIRCSNNRWSRSRARHRSASRD